MTPSARAAASISPVPTRAPPARMMRATATTSGTIEDSSGPHAVEVLADLERHAQRLVERAVAAQRAQRLRPRDRLPHARLLVELRLAQPRDRLHDARHHRLLRPGHAGPDDRRLALRRR